MTETELNNTTDARIWAREFCRVVGDKVPAIREHEGLVAGWFANAIEAARAEESRTSSDRAGYPDAEPDVRHTIECREIEGFRWPVGDHPPGVEQP